jgi:hypothetical protein
MALNHRLGIVYADASKYLSNKAWKHLSFQQILQLITSPVSLRDDVVRYMADTLQWIPCYNPATRRKHPGLNLYGITLLTWEGASSAKAIFENWARLFSLGPERLRLTGMFATTLGTNDPGKYSILSLNRNRLVRTLCILAAQCEEVANSDGRGFILHLGI